MDKKPRNFRTPKFQSSLRSEFANSNVTERHFTGPIRPLLADEKKQSANIEELTFDFSNRIIRLYKYLNEGKLSKADRDVIGAIGLQLLRSATSINANINEAQHPQSDADFLSKANISLKEARETLNWLNVLAANGYLTEMEHRSLLADIERILKILVTIVGKVSKRIKK